MHFYEGIYSAYEFLNSEGVVPVSLSMKYLFWLNRDWWLKKEFYCFMSEKNIWGIFLGVLSTADTH